MSSKPATGNSPVLEAADLDVVYPLPDGDVVAVKNFQLAIRQSEFVGLVGESGSGKSTAALALMALVRQPGRITRGKVCFNGDNLLEKDDDELRRIRGRSIGLIVQNSRSALNPLVSVGDQIANVYQAHHDVSRADALQLAVQSIKAIGIPDAQSRAASFPHQLSGGMAQRILIAMSHINEPEVVI